MSKKIKLFIMFVMMIMTGNCFAKPISPYFTFSVDTVNVGGPVNAPIMFYGASGLRRRFNTCSTMEEFEKVCESIV